MAVWHINDYRVDIDTTRGGSGEINTNDWIATVESGGYKVYQYNYSTKLGTAYSTTLQSSHPYNIQDLSPQTPLEPLDVVLKVIPYSTTPGATAETRLIHCELATTLATGVGVNIAITAGGAVTFKVKLGGFTLGTVAATAGTEYVVHYRFDDAHGFHLMEIFTLAGTLTGRVHYTSNALDNVIGVVDEIRLGADKFTNPASGTIVHKLRHMYILDHSTEFGQDWFGWDYNVVADQSFVDSNVNWAPSAGANQDAIDDWGPDGVYNSSDDGTTNDLEDEFSLTNYPGSKTVRAVSHYSLARKNSAAQRHYSFIDDGSNHLRGPFIYGGTGSAIDSNEQHTYNLAPDGGIWTNADYDNLLVGYEKYNSDNSGRWMLMDVVIVFYVEANQYGAAPRDRHISTSSD
ncbi:hypothetical protein LCGC14_1564510 [marine sediment metagenome]|uniref:Uncharacterized protein n=1 Tax=marine sediment metagenome TaxID=412755 RepID=A0A0F9J7N2_9ZZZZ